MQRRFGQVRGLTYRAYVFIFSADNESKPTSDRKPLIFTGIDLGHVDIANFRKSPKGELRRDDPQILGSSPLSGTHKCIWRSHYQVDVIYLAM
jgi:hypothetical protein